MIGVGITAVVPARFAFHKIFPSSGLIPTTLSPVNCTYCFTPPISQGTMEEYAAVSVKSFVRQITSPVCLLRATTAPLRPPGVQISFSPSMVGDSEYPQPLIMAPPKSLVMLLAQACL